LIVSLREGRRQPRDAAKKSIAALSSWRTAASETISAAKDRRIQWSIEDTASEKFFLTHITMRAALSGSLLYYEPAEIFFDLRLVPDSTIPEKYSHSGAPIPFDPAGIWNMQASPKLANYPAGSAARADAERFNGIYTNLQNSLPDLIIAQVYGA
jgi:hypothetical protein